MANEARVGLVIDTHQAQAQIQNIQDQLNKLSGALNIGGVNTNGQGTPSPSPAGSTNSADQQLLRYHNQELKRMTEIQKTLQQLERHFSTQKNSPNGGGGNNPPPPIPPSGGGNGGGNNPPSPSNPPSGKNDLSKVMAAIGALKGVYSYVSSGADRAIADNSLAYKTYGSNRSFTSYVTARKYAENMGAKYGMQGSEVMSANQTYMNSGGGWRGQEQNQDAMNAILSTSKWTGTNSNTMANMAGRFASNGSFKDTRALTEAFSGSLEETGMVGRSEEQASALSSINDNLSSNNTNVTQEAFGNSLGLYQKLAQNNGALSGQKGANAVNAVNNLMTSGDQDVMVAMGLGTKYTGLKGEHELKRILENDPTKAAQMMYQNLKTAGGEDYAYEGVQELLIQHGTGANMAKEIVDAIKNGGDLNAINEDIKKGKEANNEGEQNYNNSEVSTQEQYIANMANASKNAGDALNSFTDVVKNAINQLPQGAQSVVGGAEAVVPGLVGGAVVGKIAASVGAGGGLGAGLGGLGHGLLGAGKVLAKGTPLLAGLIGAGEAASDFSSGNMKSGWGDVGSTVGSLAGGAIGLLGGPLGAIAGSAIGGVAGNFIGKGVSGLLGATDAEDASKATEEQTKATEKQTKEVSDAKDKQERLLTSGERELTKNTRALESNTRAIRDKDSKNKTTGGDNKANTKFREHANMTKDKSTGEWKAKDGYHVETYNGKEMGVQDGYHIDDKGNVVLDGKDTSSSSSGASANNANNTASGDTPTTNVNGVTVVDTSGQLESPQVQAVIEQAQKTADEAKENQHREGLAEVPKDGYVATLHKGEAVLTAEEKQMYEKYLEDKAKWQSMRNYTPTSEEVSAYTLSDAEKGDFTKRLELTNAQIKKANEKRRAKGMKEAALMTEEQGLSSYKSELLRKQKAAEADKFNSEVMSKWNSSQELANIQWKMKEEQNKQTRAALGLPEATTTTASTYDNSAAQKEIDKVMKATEPYTVGGGFGGGIGGGFGGGIGRNRPSITIPKVGGGFGGGIGRNRPSITIPKVGGGFGGSSGGGLGNILGGLFGGKSSSGSIKDVFHQVTSNGPAGIIGGLAGLWMGHIGRRAERRKKREAEAAALKEQGFQQELLNDYSAKKVQEAKANLEKSFQDAGVDTSNSAGVPSGVLPFNDSGKPAPFFEMKMSGSVDVNGVTPETEKGFNVKLMDTLKTWSDNAQQRNNFQNFLGNTIVGVRNV